jgi:hypothetical protein
MSRRSRLVALAVALMAAVLCLAMAGSSDSAQDDSPSRYLCNLWNDRSWAGCG